MPHDTSVELKNVCLLSKKYWKRCYLKSAGDIAKLKYCNCKKEECFSPYYFNPSRNLERKCKYRNQKQKCSFLIFLSGLLIMSINHSIFLEQRVQDWLEPEPSFVGGGFSKRLFWIVEDARRTNRGWRQNLRTQLIPEYLLTNVPADNYSLNRN